jgi:N-hydroxyarylamine O-acetyltransferase
MFELDAYLERIGHRDVPKVDLDTLRALHALHVGTIPFENLDPFLGRHVSLDIEPLVAKLVRGRRGGYCFEQNTLLAAALEAIGFRVTPLGGRVRWMSAPDSPLGARTHMVLRVDLDGEAFLVDTGFGAHVQDAPLRLFGDGDQKTPVATYRLRKDGDLHALEVKQAGGYRTAFVFTLEPQVPADFVVANWYTSTHPTVLFKNALLAERVTPRARVRLLNRKVTEHSHGGAPVERLLASPADLAHELESTFGIEPPEPVEAIFARLPPSP